MPSKAEACHVPRAESGDNGAVRLDQRASGILTVALASLLWGTTGTSASFALGVPRFAVSATASVIGGTALVLIGLPAIRQQRHRIARFDRATLVAGMVGIALFPLGFYSAMQLAGVAVGTVVTIAASPAIGGIIETITERRRLSWAWYLAATVGILGASILCLSRIADSPAHGVRTVAGVLLGIAAGGVFAHYSWVIRRMMSHGISRNATLGTLFAGAVPILAVVALVFGRGLPDHRVNLLVIGYLAAIPIFGAYVLYSRGLARISASTALTITLLEPATAGLLAVLVVGERLSPVGWAGMALIAASLAITVVWDTSTGLEAH